MVARSTINCQELLGFFCFLFPFSLVLQCWIFWVSIFVQLFCSFYTLSLYYTIHFHDFNPDLRTHDLQTYVSLAHTFSPCFKLLYPTSSKMAAPEFSLKHFNLSHYRVQMALSSPKPLSSFCSLNKTSRILVTKIETLRSSLAFFSYIQFKSSN